MHTKEPSFQVIQYSPGGNEVLVSATPVYDENATFIGVVSNFRDLSSLNEVRSSLELIDLKYRMMLEQKDTLLDRMRKRLSVIESDMRNIGVVSESKQMRDLVALAQQVSGVNSTVLVTGESGVGKDVFCRMIHHLSGGTQPYVKVSCAAIPETLLESELFGYEPGAFTGANRHGKAGLLEQAENGILFLDEIGTMSLRLQSKLLTLLQDRWYYRVGGTQKTPLKARIMAATNIDLKQAVADGTFRGDLYYRLNVIPVNIPPLRERREDIVPLADHMIKKLNATYGKSKVFSNDALAAFKRYDWPGNTRELNNVVERMYVLSPGDVIGVDLLPSDVFGPAERMSFSMAFSGKTLKESIQKVEAILIQEALQQEEPLQSIAIRLGISLSTLERKAKNYGLPLRYHKAPASGAPSLSGSPSGQ
jgi:transcriptional regulator with PAS, ATPase and Fis domain